MPLWAVLGIGLVGAAIGTALRIPAGAMIGALIIVAAASLVSGRSSSLPLQITQAGRVLLGTVIGSTINRPTLELLGSALLPAFLAAIGLIGISLGLGYLIGRIAGMDRATALCAFVPGGMGEMTAVAHELGADVRVVAALHVLRVIVILVLVPVVVFLVVGLV